MIYTIENELLKAAISTKGAEVKSLILKESGKEYIWYGKEEIWNGQAPMLFPVIARLKDGEYSYKGDIYQIPMHGFAREMEFEVLKQADDAITFVLKADEATLKMYPFHFELQVHYTLTGNTLKKDHTIINHGTNVMYYELGGHDGYNICLEEGETMEDYYIDYGNLDALYPLCCDENIMMLKDTYKVPLTEGKLTLAMDVFSRDALVLHGVPVHTVTIKSKKSDRSIKFDFDEAFNTLGIWTKYLPYETNYVCLEPWTTLPDCAYLGKEIEEKVDVRLLAPGTQENLTFSVTIK